MAPLPEQELFFTSAISVASRVCCLWYFDLAVVIGAVLFWNMSQVYRVSLPYIYTTFFKVLAQMPTQKNLPHKLCEVRIIMYFWYDLSSAKHNMLNNLNVLGKQMTDKCGCIYVCVCVCCRLRLMIAYWWQSEVCWFDGCSGAMPVPTTASHRSSALPAPCCASLFASFSRASSMATRHPCRPSGAPPRTPPLPRPWQPRPGNATRTSCACWVGRRAQWMSTVRCCGSVRSARASAASGSTCRRSARAATGGTITESKGLLGTSRKSVS